MGISDTLTATDDFGPLNLSLSGKLVKNNGIGSRWEMFASSAAYIK
jgi:hypothetical protein